MLEEHDESHKDCIKDYEENQFYCKVHNNEYNSFCLDCKKDLCSLCIKDHENHKLTNFDDITPDLNKIKNIESKEIKEKIIHLKTIISGMIYRLNHLNKNLDVYFEIYDTIMSNFDIKKRAFYKILIIWRNLILIL